MALLFIDSFDHYDFKDLNAKDYSFTGDGASIGNIAFGEGRRSGAALKYFAPDSVFTHDYNPADTLVMGFAMRPVIYRDHRLIRIIDSGSNVLVQFSMNTSGQLILISGGVTKTSGAAAFTPNTYSYYEIKYVKGTGANGFAELRKDGVILLTISTSTETTQATGFGSSVEDSGTVSTWFMDDLYILDGTGSVNNDYLGDVRVDAHFADADGAYDVFVPSSGAASWTHVDDPLPDDDVTFVEAGTITAADVHSMTTASLGTVIHGVQQDVLARKTDAGIVTVDVIAEKPSGSGQKINATETASDDYQFHMSILEDDPDDSTTWTDAKINAQEWGYRINNIVT